MFGDDECHGEDYPLMSQFGAPVKPPVRDIIGREFFRDTLMATLARPEMCNALLLAPPGSGKAHPNSTLIPVNDVRGYIPIGLAQVGDETFDHNGKPVRISGVYPQGMKRRYRVHTNDGRYVDCNDEHLFTVSVDGGKWETHTLRELMNSGITDEYGDLRFELPLNKTLERQHHDFPMSPYTFGVLLMSAAFVGADKRLVLVSDTLTKDQIEAVGQECGWEVYEHVDGSWSFRDGSGVTVCRHHVCTHPLITGALAKPRGQRPIPRAYLCGSPEQIDSLALGIVHAIGKSWAHLDDSFACLGHNLTVRTKAPFIMRVDDMGDECEMTCIQVDSTEHLYQVTMNHIVTHNTALVQSCVESDGGRDYVEIDMARMITNLENAEEMAARLKSLFDEAERYVVQEDREIVLFIDEFHQVIHLSNAAVEALKPLLATSGTRGIKVIAATTFDEYDQYVSSNQPLVERFGRINLPPTDRETTVAILKGVAEKYGVSDLVASDTLYHNIYDYTNRYMPASVQPRKSIALLDAMVGWYRVGEDSLDHDLLRKVLRITYNVDVDIDVDATSIKRDLDKRVFSQEFATATIERRLQLCVAGLNDPTKPMASMMFTGSTGVGKTQMVKELTRILFGDAQEHFIRFDMSEWGQDSSVDLFREELTKKVWANSHCVLLFDEIEKASRLVTRLLLQVLDDGRLSNKDNRQVSFLNTYIVLTTNAGSEVYNILGGYHNDEENAEAALANESVRKHLNQTIPGSAMTSQQRAEDAKIAAIKAKAKEMIESGEMFSDYMPMIKASIMNSAAQGQFPPELLGRIDTIVPFMPLDVDTKRLITEKKLAELVNKVKRKHGVTVRIPLSDPNPNPEKGSISPVDYLVFDQVNSNSDSGGAREIATKIDELITAEVAKFINANPQVKHIRIIKDGLAAYENPSSRKSQARIRVLAITENL